MGGAVGGGRSYGRGGAGLGGSGGDGAGLAVKPEAQLQGRVRLPVTLAVACYIIYADMNLMEHMCVRVRVHVRVCLCVSAPADILPRLAEPGGMRGPDWLTTKPYHSSARTHNSARTSPVYF